MKYRSDIDGLRALAVTLVVLFHAHLLSCTGGFIGVDVFFVISGFLITGILCSDLEKGRFSFLGFYERRIRRIFPILFLVLGFISFASFVVLLSDQFAYFGRQLVASGFFVTNIFIFRGQEDYFAPNSAENPLLHLWSLSIEEQFYLLYPLALFLIWTKARKQLTRSLVAIAVLSLAASVWKLGQNPSAAFYFAHFRIWELLAGGILNRVSKDLSTEERTKNILGLAGLALILYAAFTYSPTTRFPGLAALLPVLGTVALIHAGSGESYVQRWLSLRPLVFLGKISYGLYLWHWPLFVFAEMIYPGDLGLGSRWMIVGVSLLISTITHKLVEVPLGNNGFKLPRRAVFVGAFSLVFIAFIFGVNCMDESGQLARWQSEGTPEIRILRTDESYALRYTHPGSREKKVVLWGDSFAQTLLRTFEGKMAALGRESAYLTVPGCIPVNGLSLNAKLNSAMDLCKGRDRYYQSILRDRSITDVILLAYWERYIVGKMPARFKHKEWLLCDATTCPDTFAEREALFLPQAKKMFADLRAHGKRVVVIGPVPGPGFMANRMAKLSRRFGFAPRQFKRSDLGEGYWRLIKTFETLEKETGAVVLYPHKVLCGERCITEKDGEILYFDEHHLNAAGNQFLWDFLHIGDLFSTPRQVSGKSQ